MPPAPACSDRHQAAGGSSRNMAHCRVVPPRNLRKLSLLCPQHLGQESHSRQTEGQLWGPVTPTWLGKHLPWVALLRQTLGPPCSQLRPGATVQRSPGSPSRASGIRQAYVPIMTLTLVATLSVSVLTVKQGDNPQQGLALPPRKASGRRCLLPGLAAGQRKTQVHLSMGCPWTWGMEAPVRPQAGPPEKGPACWWELHHSCADLWASVTQPGAQGQLPRNMDQQQAKQGDRQEPQPCQSGRQAGEAWVLRASNAGGTLFAQFLAGWPRLSGSQRVAYQLRLWGQLHTLLPQMRPPFPLPPEGLSHNLGVRALHILFASEMPPQCLETAPWQAGRAANEGWAQNTSNKLPITSVPQDKLPGR